MPRAAARPRPPRRPMGKAMAALSARIDELARRLDAIAPQGDPGAGRANVWRAICRASTRRPRARRRLLP